MSTPILFLLPAESDHHLFLEQQIQEFFADAAGSTSLPSSENNPDLIIVNSENSSLKINDVRSVIQESAYQPYQFKQRLIVLTHLDSASIPAQNALLKFLEEPPRYLQVYATATQDSVLLPTILSRCIVTKVKKEGLESAGQAPADGDETQNLFEKITTAQVPELLSLATEYKDRQTAHALLSGLVTYIHSQNGYPSSAFTKHLSQLQESLHDLETNCHVQLTLETCFFKLAGHT